MSNKGLHICLPLWLTLPSRFANKRAQPGGSLRSLPDFSVIGGLISDSANDSVTKVPLLGDIPVLGWLFKTKSTDRNRQELLVFVTTRLMGD